MSSNSRQFGSMYTINRRASAIMLPPIDECLFGPTRQCPVISAAEADSANQDDGADNNGMPKLSGFSDKISSSAIDILYDSLDLGHWAEAAKQYDIDLAQLRKSASQGIPDEGSFRAITWRVLLNYLPPKDIQESWAIQVPPKRDFYRNLVEQYFQEPMEDGRNLRGIQNHKTARNRKSPSKLKVVDEQHQQNSEDQSVASAASDGSSSCGPPPAVEDVLPPKFKEQWKRSGITLEKMTSATSPSPEADLNLNHLKVPKLDNDSPQDDFSEFLEDAMLLEEIRKDVTRTMPHLLFFLEPTCHLGLRRYAALERVLFLWAKLNKGVRYVQGMNEIAGTIYYVLANDQNSEWANHAEADSYFLFHALMMDIRDVFVPDMDSHTTGIQGRIETMERLLETHDPEVCAHLQKCGIDSHFWAYRWLTTLLSREFLLPDTIRLWDSMFASTHKDNFLRYVCVTMVMKVREELLSGDFSSNLRLLQRFPPTNVDAILDSSRSLWMYETKIRVAMENNGLSLEAALQTVAPPSSIIMAFGLKKGIAPNFKERLEDALSEGLLGSARRFLSGWKDTEAAPADEAVPTPASVVAPPSETPPLSRFWNRARRNTDDSEKNLQNSEDAAGAPASPSTTTSINDNMPSLSEENVEKKEEDEASSSDTPAAPRRRIWNRSPASRTPEVMAREVQLPESTAPLPSLQPSSSSSSTATSTSPAIDANASRWPLWKNRGWVTDTRSTAAT